ncbi:DUF559 domain-containing protein [Candidatus Poribacteria bacterium]|nr:DUF559 domain-containing protein [Candidatus Poribacteria bacterium]
MLHPQNYPLPEVLVAIMNNRRDLEIARTERWYRIPVRNADRLLPDLRQMRYLAFYQTKIFKREAYAVNYYAAIERITTARRHELLPDEAGNQNADAPYYKLEIALLRRLSQPIPSKRLRRVTFITTTLEKLMNAREINDLFHTSWLEDQMWAALKEAGIISERQYEIRERGANYNLDFAIECKDKHWINIECDGDTYHSTKAERDHDRKRNTYLTTKGWSVQRFGTEEIRNDSRGCIAQIRELMDRHGGPVDRSLAYALRKSDSDSQLDLF